MLTPTLPLSAPRGGRPNLLSHTRSPIAQALQLTFTNASLPGKAPQTNLNLTPRLPCTALQTALLSQSPVGQAPQSTLPFTLSPMGQEPQPTFPLTELPGPGAPTYSPSHSLPGQAPPSYSPSQTESHGARCPNLLSFSNSLPGQAPLSTLTLSLSPPDQAHQPTLSLSH